jgi:ADP-ribose pyrophosphatase
MRPHGPWRIVRSDIVHLDPWIQVTVDQVIRPDGHPGTYSTVQLKSGVCVLAIDEQQNVHLTSEFHYAVARDTIEAVSGGIEPGETPEKAARRELAEELGLEAGSWQRLATIDPFTAAIHSTVSLFVARELRQVDRAPEGTEVIKPVVMPLNEAIQAVREGTITHAPTCIMLLHLALELALQHSSDNSAEAKL